MILLLENNKMLTCNIKMQKKRQIFLNWSAAGTADLRSSYQDSDDLPQIRKGRLWDL